MTEGIKEVSDILKFEIAENDGEISKEFMDYFADPMNWDDSMLYDF